MSKCKRISPRVPEGEGIEDMEDMSMEELSDSFKLRLKEYQKFVNFLVEELGIKGNSNILEIGPGPGWITILLVKKEPKLRVTGLEISEDMIRVANKNAEEEGVSDNIKYIKGDAKKMDLFEKNSFDAVISHDSLHHWENPTIVFNEIARVLKDNGKFCIRDGRRDIGLGAKFIFNIVKYLRLISKTMSYYWGTSIKAGYTPEELTQILDDTELIGNYEIKVGLFDLTVVNI